MNYNVLEKYQSRSRYCVCAKNGMVATGSALASSAGLEILQKGGTAALTVVEPTANGLGSDAFAIVWMKDKMYGLNASGYTPKHLTADYVKLAGYSKEMPKHGWLPVMVPGAVKGWVRLSEQFGKLSFAEVLAPAIRLAEEGYPISCALSESWQKAVEQYKKIGEGKREFKGFFQTFTKNGESYQFGDIVQLKDHAKSLRLIAETMGEAFYKGEIADQLIKQSLRDGGVFTKEDLANYDVEWVKPIGVNYRGYDVWEIPPNGQGITALMALNILKEFSLEERNPASLHKQIEAMKLAFADGKYYISDVKDMRLDYHRLILPEYGKARAKEITDMAGMPISSVPPKSGTVYLCTADGEGNMVSYIQSNYMGFGSGIVLEGYGVALQNRGADFSLDEDDANYLKPQKRTYHTIIPGFLTKGKEAIGPFGVMGGYMQPQGHVQVISNMIDFHMNPQMALDSPRWQWVSDRKVLVERDFDEAIVRDLLRRGHEVEYSDVVSSFGRGEIIHRTKEGVLIGACESRTDANIACY